jgi:ribosomal-protein-alanine N-acetyltransferase
MSMLRTIRMMTSADLDAVLAIELACSVDPWSRTIFSACLERHQCYAMVCEGTVIGFAVLMFVDTECQILNLAIMPDYQHRGHGKFLLADLIRSARLEGGKELLLEVRCSNAAAIALYKKMGFRIVGHRKDYYLTREGREDAHLMLLNLDSKKS